MYFISSFIFVNLSAKHVRSPFRLEVGTLMPMSHRSNGQSNKLYICATYS